MDENKEIEVQIEGAKEDSSELNEMIQSESKSSEKGPKKSKKQIKEEREEARRKELAGLSDDELYARIQTEKLLRSRKNRKIATITTLCVAFVLALCIIVMAVVPVSYVPTCLSGEISSVKLYEGSSSAVATLTKDDTSERYQKFMSVFKSCFSQSYLNALFSGSLTSYDIDEKGGTSLGEYTGKDTSLSNAISLAGDNYLVQIDFASQQTFTYQNGKTYKSVYSGNSSDGVLNYSTAYLTVSTDEDSGITSTEIYIVAVFASSSYESGYGYRIFSVTVKADTSLIYSNWKALCP